MEDSDKENIETESLEQQFLVVKNETNTSMVCQYGQFNSCSFQEASNHVPRGQEWDQHQHGLPIWSV